VAIHPGRTHRQPGVRFAGLPVHPRASPDGVRGAEGTFSACSFWYVEALARAGRLDEARLAFEKMLTYANHVGLYAEQISRAGQQQGNFPRR
jgi:pentatricopeptide repeat protein